MEFWNNIKNYINSFGSNYAKDTLKQGKEYAKEYAKEKSRATLNHAKNAGRETLKYSGQSIKSGTKIVTNSSWKWIKSTSVFRIGRIGLISALIGRICYVYGTFFSQTITVSKTFNRLQETQGGIKNEYVIVDKDQKLYTVVSSAFYLQFFPDELWSMFRSGETYHIQGYGIRIRRFGIHPRIVKAIRNIDLEQKEGTDSID